MTWTFEGDIAFNYTDFWSIDGYANYSIQAYIRDCESRGILVGIPDVTVVTDAVSNYNRIYHCHFTATLAPLKLTGIPIAFPNKPYYWGFLKRLEEIPTRAKRLANAMMSEALYTQFQDDEALTELLEARRVLYTDEVSWLRQHGMKYPDKFYIPRQGYMTDPSTVQELLYKARDVARKSQIE